MTKSTIKKCVAILFVIYVIALIYVLFMDNRQRFGMFLMEITPFSKAHVEMFLNLIPFKTEIDYFKQLAEHSINTRTVIMNIGVNYLREHMKSECRVHYAMVDGGGFSPNVVQPHASVLYMVRAISVKDTLELQERVDKCAEGAALMTGTTYDRIFVDGTANTVPNTTLEKVLYSNMQAVPLPEYTKEETEYIKALDATCPAADDVAGRGAKYDAAIREEVPKLTEKGTKPINDFVMPFYTGNEFEAGSTDVGDVSWQTPAAQFNAVCFTAHSPGHSWQNVSAGASPIGDKGTVYAAKVLACAAAELFEKPEIIEAANKEFKERLGDSEYTCPIPEGAEPYIVEE